VLKVNPLASSDIGAIVAGAPVLAKPAEALGRARNAMVSKSGQSDPIWRDPAAVPCRVVGQHVSTAVALHETTFR
jgi:hypothetical protein